MPIPFIRGYPDGRRGLLEISRSKSIERKAGKFIAHGGRYLCEMLPNAAGPEFDGFAHLIAIIDINGTAKAVSEKTVMNGPGVEFAVDDLVEESVKHIPPTPKPLSLLVPAHLADHPTVQ